MISPKNNFRLVSDTDPVILLVNNDELETAYISSILYEAGYEVILADGSVRAISAILSGDVNIVILDMTMSRRELRAIREACDSLNEQAPKIVLFSSPSTISRAEAYDWGAHVVLSKPISKESLLRRLQEHDQALRSHEVSVELGTINFGKGGFCIPSITGGVFEGDEVKFRVTVKDSSMKVNGRGIVRFVDSSSDDNENKSLGLEVLEFDKDSDIDLKSMRQTKTSAYIPRVLQ
jgi:DNA-binding response OmpR family regulator